MKTLLFLLLSMPYLTGCLKNDSILDLNPENFYQGQLCMMFQQDTLQMKFHAEKVTLGNIYYFKMHRFYVMYDDTIAVDSTMIPLLNDFESQSIVAENTIANVEGITTKQKDRIDFTQDTPHTRPRTIEYAEMSIKKNCFIVISKMEQKLYVCEPMGTDTVRIVEYPVCMGRNRGPKQKSGDMKTPKSGWTKPFTIIQIQDASNWYHDFGDGRGSILAYGNWFMRLETGFQGIGIHGCTNNENSVPGRESEGCIRLNNVDLDILKEKYTFKGMKVIIKAENEGLRNFELKYY